MAKIKVAIYDADKQYRERFADYLMSYKAQEIELSVYSGITYLFEALDVENYHLLVLGCGYEEVLPRVKTIPVPVLVLSEANYVRESIGIEDTQVSYTPKYQSMDVITHQMYLMTEARRMPQDVMPRASEMEIIGVFSPVRHEMQMFFSMLYAKNRQCQGKVLYLNLMEFSGFHEIFEEEEHNLEEAILQIRGQKMRPEAIKACIYEGESFSYICPFRNPENIKEVCFQDLEAILNFLSKNTDFCTVVIDFGGVIEGFADAMKSCSSIFCIGRQGYFYDGVVEHFQKYLGSTLGKDFLERVRTVKLPYPIKGITSGVNVLEQLQWSEFGDYVRGLTDG